MATVKFITKADFTAANLVKFSQNILNDQLDAAIYAAQEYDLAPRLGDELYEALEAIAETPNAQKPELTTFLNLKVKRYLVLAAYRRFISAHGMNVTQFGLTKTADPQGTFNQAEAQERAVIVRQIDADANVSLLRLTSTPFVFDGVSYEKGENAQKLSTSIRAPKRFKNRKRSLINAYGTLGPYNLLD